MIRIGYVINSLRQNGPTKVLLSMINGLNRKKYIPYIITLIDENDESIIKKVDVEIIKINLNKNIKTLFKQNIIKKRIEELNLDIINIHGHITLFLCRNVNVKKIATVHNRLYEDFKVAYGRCLGYIMSIMYIHNLKKCEQVVCCSKSSCDYVKKIIPKARYARNGITYEEISSLEKSKIRNAIRNELGIPLNAKIYLYAGNFTKTKRVSKMVEYLSKSLKEEEYLIALGTGPVLEKCRKYASKRIIFLGFKTNVRDYMYASDIYISFSESEGFSISIIEALNSNLLLLLSNIPSHKECFEIDRSMYIGEYFNEKDFFVKKEKVSNYNKEINSNIFQKKYLSSKSMMNEYEIVYDKVASNK